MSFLYFCYGSNLLANRMRINCPSATRKCIAKLKDFKLAFEGYFDGWKGATATILENPGDSVWGVVWEISKEQESKLDSQESKYKPIEVVVQDPEGTEILCKTYQKLPTASDDYNMPSLVYKTVMIQGAKESNLPEFYIQYMEAIKDNGYNGKVDAVPANITS